MSFIDGNGIIKIYSKESHDCNDFMGLCFSNELLYILLFKREELKQLETRKPLVMM